MTLDYSFNKNILSLKIFQIKGEKSFKYHHKKVYKNPNKTEHAAQSYAAGEGYLNYNAMKC